MEHTMRRTFAIALVASAAALAGCTTPYSQLYGTRYYRAPIDTYPVTVVAVDGSHYLRQPVQVEPGTRRVTVQGPPTAAQRPAPEKTITLDVKPCTRYYLVAQKSNRLTSDFDVKIDYEEPIPGCRVSG
jgi:hypothetical protein